MKKIIKYFQRQLGEEDFRYLAAFVLYLVEEVAWADGKLDEKEKNWFVIKLRDKNVSHPLTYEILDYIYDHIDEVKFYTKELIRNFDESIEYIEGLFNDIEELIGSTSFYQFKQEIVILLKELAGASRSFPLFGPRVSKEERAIINWVKAFLDIDE